MKEKTFGNSIYNRTTVYLEDRYEKPKHLFKIIGDKVEVLVEKFKEFRLLDVGGVSGELAYYPRKRFPKIRTHCLDLDKLLIERGKG